MAIVTLDGVLAGMQLPTEFTKIGAGTQVAGRPYTPMYAAGNPGAMTAPAGGIQGLGLTSKATALYWANPSSGNTYLAKLSCECINTGTLLLCDRLWENSGNSSTSTGAQASTLAISAITQANPTEITCAAHGQAAGTFVVHITGSNSNPVVDGTYVATYVSATKFTIPVNVATGAGNTGLAYICPPPRDKFATAVPNSNANAVYGTDVLLAYEVSGTMGSGTPTFAVTYVNSAGVAARTSPTLTFATTHIIGTFIPIPFQAGDVGIRAVVSHIKNATQNSGTYHLVMYRVLARVGVPVAGLGYAVDAITGGFVRAYDDTCPFLVWIPGSTTAPTYLSAQVIWTQG